MINGVSSDIVAGNVKVHITNNRGFTPEEWAVLAAERIVGISDGAPQPIRDQAHAFKDQVTSMVAHYIRLAVREERSAWLAKGYLNGE